MITRLGLASISHLSSALLFLLLILKWEFSMTQLMTQVIQSTRISECSVEKGQKLCSMMGESSSTSMPAFEVLGHIWWYALMNITLYYRVTILLLGSKGIIFYGVRVILTWHRSAWGPNPISNFFCGRFSKRWGKFLIAMSCSLPCPSSSIWQFAFTFSHGMAFEKVHQRPKILDRKGWCYSW